MSLKNQFIDNLSFKDYTFIKKPVRYSLNDYEKAERRFVDRHSKNKGVISIYRFGGKIFPGLSDLDYILVLNNRLRNNGDYPKLNCSNYFVKDKPILVDQELMRNINQLVILHGFKRCYGKSFELEKFEDSAANESKLVLVNELILALFPRVFLKILLSSKIDTRSTISLVKTLRNALILFSSIDRKYAKMVDGKYKHYMDKVDSLRQNWFNSNKNKYKELFELVKESVYVSLDFIRMFSLYLENRKLSLNNIDGKRPNSILFLGRSRYAFFIDNWDEEKALNYMINFCRKSGLHAKIALRVLPLQMAAYLTNYSEGNSRFNYYFRKRWIGGEVKWNVKDDLGIGRKVELVNHYCDFLKANKLTSGYFYPFFGFSLGFRPFNNLKHGVAGIMVKNYVKSHRL